MADADFGDFNAPPSFCRPSEMDVTRFGKISLTHLHASAAFAIHPR
jgi:hypothetical protein